MTFAPSYASGYFREATFSITIFAARFESRHPSTASIRQAIWPSRHHIQSLKRPQRGLSLPGRAERRLRAVSSCDLPRIASNMAFQSPLGLQVSGSLSRTALLCLGASRLTSTHIERRTAFYRSASLRVKPAVDDMASNSGGGCRTEDLTSSGW